MIDKKTNIILSYIVLGLLICSCASKQDYIGLYYSEDDNINFVLEEQNFLITNTKGKSNSPYKCCDTISYGNWEKVKNNDFIKISSPNNFNTNVINISVNEYLNNSTDSIYLIINNPIENHYKKFSETYRELYYSIEISSNNTDFNARVAQMKWNTNQIQIQKPKGLIIDEITIVIVPKSDMKVRSLEAKIIYTSPYKVINNKNNSFKIELSSLSYQYINLLRLFDDFVKIEKESLIWNKKIFKKKT